MKRLPAEDRASEIFLPPMVQRDTINVGIWCMEKQGSPALIDAAGSSDAFKGNGVPIFACDVNPFGLQSKVMGDRENHLNSPGFIHIGYRNPALGLLIRFLLVPLES